MENKIISINISPGNDEEINENAGVMWEHNATSLVFSIDPSYVGDYRYYIEYRSLMGTKVRTEYLELNREDNTVTYDIPVTMTSLCGVECFFNIVNINADGETVQVIKPKKFCLQFDYSPDTDNSLAKVNDFSINALLEAIRTGAFKGEPGEPIANMDSSLSETSKNPVQNKVIYNAFNTLIADFEKAIESTKSSIEATMVKYANSNFVAKEDSKGLSSNDFTDEYKEKLDSVDENPATQITAIDESTEYGGSSVITFNDGNSLTIKNGTKGINGYTPVKGIDYYTESEKEEFKNEGIVLISEELAKRGQLKPEFANDISECTDTSKLYVLPDNYIYAYMKTTTTEKVPKFTNLLDFSKCLDESHIGSSGAISSQSNRLVTHIIPVTGGTEHRFRGYGTSGIEAIAELSEIPSSVAIGSTLDTFIKKTKYSEATSSTYEYVQGFIGAAESVHVVTLTTQPATKYVMLELIDSSDYTTDQIRISIDEEIDFGTHTVTSTTTDWHSTGHAFVPADYEKEILDHEDRIADLECKTVESILKGKKIVYDGDSICASSSDPDNGGAYPKIIAELVNSVTGAETKKYYDNQSVGGARLVTADGATDKDGKAVTLSHSIVDNLVNLPTDADLYCFEGGCNDHWNGVPLGDFSSTDYTGTLDTKTMCGALEYIFRYATTNFIGKPICFIITHKCPYQNEINGNSFADFREKMIGVCEKYAIPYYDAWAESGLNYWNEKHLDNYFVNFSTKAEAGDGDGTHPNTEGYKRYYVPQLISLFEKIMPR